MIYAIYDQAGRRLGAEANREVAVRLSQGHMVNPLSVREEPGEAHPSGCPPTIPVRDAVDRLRNSLERAVAAGEIEP